MLVASVVAVGKVSAVEVAASGVFVTTITVGALVDSTDFVPPLCPIWQPASRTPNTTIIEIALL
ncbi:hypothetical protein SDC9_95860 [bioreactor metagenome]|uniref:Uncharacterized protein n=1 Tax=bioreactor metagenome TaxID=1076179 RepID=A0A645A7P3_9ZZZZ